MKFTTHFELHSQTTRLCGDTALKDTGHRAINGVLTLHDLPFQGSLTRALFGRHPPGANNSGEGQAHPDFMLELLPFRSPLLRESLLVSFPRLIDMLKFRR